jgi:hypothetical protein
MERRVLIAVLLSFLVLYGYQALFPPPPEPKPAQTHQQGRDGAQGLGPDAVQSRRRPSRVPPPARKP